MFLAKCSPTAPPLLTYLPTDRSATRLRFRSASPSLPLRSGRMAPLRFCSSCCPFIAGCWRLQSSGRAPKIPRFNRDLEAASISLVGEDGRKVHFHSLRHTFCTLLQVHGASLREAQALMRHSEPRLTQIQYTDASQLPLAPAIGRLPKILGDSRIDSLNTSQTPVQSCPEVSARVSENEFVSLPQLHDGKPLVVSSVPRSPALSKNEKWCAIQGSNL